MWLKSLRWIFLFVAVIGFMVIDRGKSGSAEANLSLICRQNLVYRSDYNVTIPQVVVDSEQKVHLFWTEFSTMDQVVPAVFHAELLQGEWSQPKTVLLEPSGATPNGLNVSADQTGNLYVLFTGANNTLYFSKVQADKAGQPLAWLYPQAIASALLHPGMFVDASGAIHVAYPLLEGVFYMTSKDGGEHWSLPTGVSAPQSYSNAPDYVQVAVDQQGGIHVVWTEFQLPRGWPPAGLYYSHSFDGGKTWSEPHQFTSKESAQINLVISPSGEIHVGWNGWAALGGRYHSLSTDGGDSWSSTRAVIPAGIGGISGYPDLVFDAADTLYYVVPAYDDAIVVIPWQNGLWGNEQRISGDFNAINYQNFSIEHPQAGIGSGNQLHVVFESGFVEIYHVVCQTETMEISSQNGESAVKTQEVYQNATSQAKTAVPQRTEIVYDWDETPVFSAANVSSPVLFGALFVLIFLLVGVILFRKR